MYNFRDTIDNTTAGSALPAEAMSYDGVYIENKIKGYRTLFVSGRELLGSEVQELSNEALDGSQYVRRRYPARTITVTYQLLCDTEYEFRESYNQLNDLLKGEQVQIIFNDETDKYFVGTKVGNTDPAPGTNKVTGEIEIYCADPFKHSATIKEFTASTSDGVTSATIVNEGTVAVPISYEITNHHDNGYIGIVRDSGAIQLGKVEEADGVTYAQNEWLAKFSNFTSLAQDYGTNYMHPQHVMGGTLVTETINGKPSIRLQSVGNRVAGKWNGGMKTFTLPADSNGAIGAKNFYCHMNSWFEAGIPGQTAEQSIAFLTADNKVICGYSLFKVDMCGNEACLEFWANGKYIRTQKFQAIGDTRYNPFMDVEGHYCIRKLGSDLTFYWRGQYIVINVPAVANMVCTKIQIAITHWDNKIAWGQYVPRNYIRDIQFQKTNVSKWRDVPNRYGSGDVVTIDGDATKVYVNGLVNYDDEMIGSKYFLAEPGETKVEFYASSFSSPAPTCKARIREAWL